MKTDVTFLGVIRRVVGAKVFVEISPEIPSASPIISGRVYRLGQVGSFVRIPLGFLNLYGVVSMVGASEISHSSSSRPTVGRSATCGRILWHGKVPTRHKRIPYAR